MNSPSAILAVPETMRAIDTLRGEPQMQAQPQQQHWQSTFAQQPTTTLPTVVYA